MDEQTRKELYQSLRAILEKHKNPFSVSEKDTQYALSTTKKIEVLGKERDGMYFAGLRENKNIVGFYFMPIYTDPDLRAKVPASLQKILKGHSCFNVKKLTPEMEQGFHELLTIGKKRYEEKGWL